MTSAGGDGVIGPMRLGSHLGCAWLVTVSLTACAHPLTDAQTAESESCTALQRDPAAIQAVLDEELMGFRDCYLAYLHEAPEGGEVQGRETLSFTIDSAGAAQDVTSKGSLQNAELSSCLAKKVSVLKFEPGGTSTVVFPLVLDTALKNLGVLNPGHGPHTKTVTVREPTSNAGRLPADVIERIMTQNQARFRSCYTKALATKPELRGRVLIRFVILRSGAVTHAETSGDLPDDDVKTCVRNAMAAIQFPQPEGGIVNASYPLVFDGDGS